MFRPCRTALQTPIRIGAARTVVHGAEARLGRQAHRRRNPGWKALINKAVTLSDPVGAGDRGIGGDARFQGTKAYHHFTPGTAAERNLAWQANTRFWEVKGEGFQVSLEAEADAAAEGAGAAVSESRNAALRRNAERDAACRTHTHLFPQRDGQQFSELVPRVSDRLLRLARSRLERCGDAVSARFTDACVREALVESNHELPLALYYLKARLQTEDDPLTAQMHEKHFDCGVVSCDVAEGAGGALVEVGCGSVAVSLSDAFLDLAKALSRTAAALPEAAEEEQAGGGSGSDLLEALLTAQLDGSDAYVADALLAFSKSVREVVTVRRVARVPWPARTLLGWHMNNPRSRHPGQASAVCFALVLLHPTTAEMMEPEWLLRLQDTLPHPVAQHCLLEPLWFNSAGRVLKQPLLSPLPRHELMRFPGGRPCLYDWLDDQCARSRLVLSRFGIISMHLGVAVAKTWVSFAAEQYRYRKLSRAVDPVLKEDAAETGDLSKDMSSADAAVKPDMDAEEMWHNEPGERSFSAQAEAEKEEMPDGFDTDDDLMNRAD